MKVAYAMLAGLVALGGCARFQPQPTTDFTPTAMVSSVTNKDSSIHYNADVLKVGTPRSTVQSSFGDPNATQTGADGKIEDVYAFNPDGTKFVDPTIRPRNIAMAVFSMGTSVAVRQARLAMQERKLTIYEVTYTSDGTIASVHSQQPSSNADAGTGAVAPPSQAAGPIE